MKHSHHSIIVGFALGNMALFGCGGSPQSTEPAATAPNMNDLSNSATAVKANDTTATFDALQRCMARARGDADAGVDAAHRRPGFFGPRDIRGRRGFRSPRRPGPASERGPGREAIAQGLDQLLEVADLDALKACQDLAKGCTQGSGSAAERQCTTMVAECVQPVLMAAFKALCEERAAECAKNRGDDACKRMEQNCSAIGNLQPASGKP